MDCVDIKAFNKTGFSSMIPGDIRSKMQSLVFKTQENFCNDILAFETFKTFSGNKWSRSELSEGVTQILEDGDVFEKVGVCVSKVSGILSPSAHLLLKESFTMNNQDILDVKDQDIQRLSSPIYFTTGISGVVYPKNPNIPILNFNYRYFEMENGKETTWWFSGGSDLTPSILNKEDCHQFHKVLKQCCDKYSMPYKSFKERCDDYYYLDHRGERHGIGGIFFNKLNHPCQDICFEFVKACIDDVIPVYMSIVLRNREKSYFSEDKEWQHTQRGRYAEFYLICDNVTKLLLRTSGVEYENILMFLPPSAKWHYNSIPDKTSKEFELFNILRNPIEWV